MLVIGHRMPVIARVELVIARIVLVIGDRMPMVARAALAIDSIGLSREDRMLVSERLRYRRECDQLALAHVIDMRRSAMNMTCDVMPSDPR